MAAAPAFKRRLKEPYQIFGFLFDLDIAVSEDTERSGSQNFITWKQPIENLHAFEEMPTELLNMIEFIESYLGVDVAMISNGPEREALILKNQAAAVWPTRLAF